MNDHVTSVDPSAAKSKMQQIFKLQSLYNNPSSLQEAVLFERRSQHRNGIRSDIVVEIITVRRTRAGNPSHWDIRVSLVNIIKIVREAGDLGEVAHLLPLWRVKKGHAIATGKRFQHPTLDVAIVLAIIGKRVQLPLVGKHTISVANRQGHHITGAGRLLAPDSGKCLKADRQELLNARIWGKVSSIVDQHSHSVTVARVRVIHGRLQGHR